MAMRYLIVGAGAAGAAAAEAIRSRDPNGSIVLLSEEAENYYSRPGLAYLLTGELAEKSLYPFSPADYQRLKIEQRLGRAERIDPSGGWLKLAGGEQLEFDRLLIATGSQALMVDLPGIQAEGVVKLDNLADARRILTLARKARQAVVVGGGITALEIVEGLAAQGLKPDYLLRGERYWGNVLDETESRIVETRLSEEGVRIHYHTELAEIVVKDGRVRAVRCKDGRELKCDLLAVAIGVRPRVELGRASGLRVNKGVWVDDSLQTELPGVYAAGDVAELHSREGGKSLMNTLWPLAREQGRIAGLNMAGADLRYRQGTPFNVTRLAGLTTTIIGAVGTGRDEDLLGIARGDSETWRELPDAIAAQSNFEVNRLRVLVGAESLVGAVVMGDQKLSRPLQRLITRQTPLNGLREALLQPGAPLADLLADFWAAQVKN